jgi:hypothetical protein
VRADLLGAARVLVVTTLALLGVAAVAPGRLELALRIYALIVAGTVIVLALLALGRAFPPESRLDVTGTRRRPPARPPSLARAQNEVVLGIASSVDLHYRLVPRLRRIASGLLAGRRSLSLTSQSEQARAVLGDQTWELVRPERPAPQDRLTTGIPARDLERVIAALESV